MMVVLVVVVEVGWVASLSNRKAVIPIGSQFPRWALGFLLRSASAAAWLDRPEILPGSTTIANPADRVNAFPTDINIKPKCPSSKCTTGDLIQ